MYVKDVYIWAWLRLFLGWIFFWAFIDKVFGLGFSTTPDHAWIRGGSPTTGFLKAGVTGPFANFFHSLAGSAVVDWLFMLGLLGVGVGLILGVAVKLSAWSGAVMLALMWLALLFPKTNPIVDDHCVYFVVLVGIALSSVRSEDYFGFGKWWKSLRMVRKHPWLA